MSLTKQDIVLRVSEATGLPQRVAFDLVQKVLDHLTAALAQGQRVELRNFGVFEVVVRSPRPGRNPKRPEVEITIPARATVKFKAGKAMQEQVGDLIRK